jgi:CheY-like chemotaxis protein
MEPFEVFEQSLREMLAHLYDPVFRPPDSLWIHLGLSRDQGIEAVRDEIVSAVEEMKPNDSVPLTARSWRVYGMLRYRFIEDLPQETAAERLGITARHLRRDIIEAVHALALRIWEKQGRELPTAKEIPAEILSSPAPALEAEWHAQLRRELDSLAETASGAVASVAETMQSVIRLGAHLTGPRQIEIVAEPVPSGLMAAIHPSALRQILLSIIDQLARKMSPGRIRLCAGHKDGRVHIQISASPIPASERAEYDHLHEFLSSQNGSLAYTIETNEISLIIELLVVDRCVLVVDDNADIVHLYRRYAAGTRYYIQHISQGQQIYEAINTFHPEVVVLDVMLPDIDGWDLLTRLHEDTSTRQLPVVICSVMREKELALALGASQYIAKPVQRSEFITALDKALDPA